MRQRATDDVRLQIHGHRYTLEVAATPAQREKGLGGRERLGQGRGMLFAFDGMSERCFWMKDMLFAIDIVWADATKKVVKVVPHVQPTTYPQQFCARARYVVELPAGETAKAHIRAGNQLSF